MDYKKRV